MEDLQKKHRQEQRELQARITQKKKNTTKKTRKGIHDECAELERQLRDRQEDELAAASGETQVDEQAATPEVIEDAPKNAMTSRPEDLDTAGIAEDLDQFTMTEKTQVKPQSQSKKPNRQKARLARRAAAQEAATDQAAKEAADLPDRRAEERKVMEKELKARGLVEHEVRSDGHCLYTAIADQMQENGLHLDRSDGFPGYKAVRRDAAAFIERHPEDFAPFLEESLDDYISKTRDTGEWGGQLELSALARAYEVEINVLQGDGRVEKIVDAGGKGPGKGSFWLAYYRHSFGLGEHYNSLRKGT